jgi:hypothetical protein
MTIAGCAGGGLDGRAVPVEPGDMAKLTGTWQGTMIFPSGASWPATLKVYPNGTYATEAGAFTSDGKAQLKNGRLDFVTRYTSGGIAVDNKPAPPRSWTRAPRGASSARAGPTRVCTTSTSASPSEAAPPRICWSVRSCFTELVGAF